MLLTNKEKGSVCHIHVRRRLSKQGPYDHRAVSVSASQDRHFHCIYIPWEEMTYVFRKMTTQSPCGHLEIIAR